MVSTGPQPLLTLRESYEFGVATGEALRSDEGLQRVALVGAGGLCDFVGEPRVGDIDEDFDRWFLEEPASRTAASCRTAQRRAQCRPATAPGRSGRGSPWPPPCGERDESLSYEAIYEGINGIAVVTWTP